MTCGWDRTFLSKMKLSTLNKEENIGDKWDRKRRIENKKLHVLHIVLMLTFHFSETFPKSLKIKIRNC